LQRGVSNTQDYRRAEAFEVMIVNFPWNASAADTVGNLAVQRNRDTFLRDGI
jgi:hypothetical protein